MLIEVTQYDIQFGVKRHCGLCPISRALHRATGKHWDVGESDQHKAVAAERKCGTIKWFELGEAASVFMKGFDEGRAVYPFAFELGFGQEPVMETPPLPMIVDEAK